MALDMLGRSEEAIAVYQDMAWEPLLQEIDARVELCNTPAGERQNPPHHVNRQVVDVAGDLLGDERFEQRQIFLAILPRAELWVATAPRAGGIEAGEFVVAAARPGKRLDILRRLISRTPYSIDPRSAARLGVPDAAAAPGR
jgi:hypothetical protein